MPIRRAAGTPPQETAPAAADGEPDVTSEESASVEEEQVAAVASEAPAAADGEDGAPADVEAEEEAKVNGEGEEAKDGEEGADGEKKDGKETEKKDDKDGAVKEKPKKPIKRSVPAWATLSASKKVVVTSKYAGNTPKVDDILLEAIGSFKDVKTGATVPSVMKYIVKKYPSLELDKRKFLLKSALKRQLEKGTIKQNTGKGFSGSFKIGTQPKASAAKSKPAATPGIKAEVLGDTLPLIITRLCEPKEASYLLIKKYLAQHFPKLNVENRPDVLKNALSRAVEKGHLEQITGKGANGTFQLKKAQNKILLKGGPMEDALLAAITAMNEPKTCSITTLRKHLLETNKDAVMFRVVNTLKKTLHRCKAMGWMEQITGNGLSGTYQLSYPYYPSPAVLFPDLHKKEEAKAEQKRKRKMTYSDDSSDEEEDEESDEESESDDEPPPPKRKAGKRPPPKARRPPPSKKSSPSKASGSKKRPAPAKKAATPAKKAAPAKKSAPPAKKAAKKPAKKAPPPAKKSTPVKKAAKSPVAKKLTGRGSKRPSPKKLPAKPAAKSAKPAARKSARGRK